MPPSSANANVPRFIALPPPAFPPGALSPPITPDDPLASPLWSPALDAYHTAPSTPIASPALEIPPPPTTHRVPLEAVASKLHIAIPNTTKPEIDVEDAFPTGEIPLDFVDNDEGLTALEKIYLFARSPSVHHRLYIVHALPSLLDQVTPQEAIDFVLPLIPYLAIDEDERVKEALVTELVSIIWWFFTNCQVVFDIPNVEETVYSSSTSTIPVQAFTPTLGTLLLSPNSKVCGGARYAVVNLLTRMRKVDNLQSTAPAPLSGSDSSDSDSAAEDAEEIVVGLFGKEERLMFEHELVEQVVIGMGRLDTEDDVDVDSNSANISQEGGWPVQHGFPPGITVVTPEEEVQSQALTSFNLEKQSPTSPLVTSYFPALPDYSVPSPGSSNSSTPSSATDTSSSSSSSSPAKHSPPIEQPARPSRTPGSPFNEVPPRSPNTTASPRPKTNVPSSASDAGTDERRTEGTDDGEGDQAAMGRLSSMSLMAAVTASGCLNDYAKDAFVKEVQRVGHDPVYWVRRESSYALGALAKVVPDEVVVLSLVPLFDTLRQDPQWHVRHSALFALPAMLSRLKPAHRRKLALDTILSLSMDESHPVRSGTLESLGEVLHTFREDPDGPPQELVHLFLGRREDKRVRDGQQAADNREQALGSLFGRPVHQDALRPQSPSTSFFTDPLRPLICAFNFPAVTLTLGSSRWGELRPTYLDLAENPEASVRRSLAASLGEMAKIIGSVAAEQDLLPLWWVAIRSDEEEIRERALDCVQDLVAMLEKPARLSVVSGLLAVWQEGNFRGWRERKAIAKALKSFATTSLLDNPKLLRNIARQALEDSVAAVREAALSALPYLWDLFMADLQVLSDLRADVERLAVSQVYRHRMTFAACLESLLSSSLRIPWDDQLWSMIPILADDAVVGVRISVARLVRLASDGSPAHHRGTFLADLMRHLALDTSFDVRAYAHGSYNVAQPTRRAKFATFSRPPPLPDAFATETLSGSINPSSPREATQSTNHLQLATGSPAAGGPPQEERSVYVPA
ncbi:hypothetical protein MIND_01040600 [Mycena indigotica]|uniref:ARM repeat-containing protein n=1 Tax=Mycena indigotica TaxID=2126181 RepID=A0A8H6S8M8_9AGAR|nr:uncharacterized protein MIND_01040600 [Mycena indigotica]KAF7295025.1 hypothetical protein MIND_01040600 [Mycena indigotica]